MVVLFFQRGQIFRVMERAARREISTWLPPKANLRWFGIA